MLISINIALRFLIAQLKNSCYLTAVANIKLISSSLFLFFYLSAFFSLFYLLNYFSGRCQPFLVFCYRNREIFFTKTKLPFVGSKIIPFLRFFVYWLPQRFQLLSVNELLNEQHVLQVKRTDVQLFQINNTNICFLKQPKKLIDTKFIYHQLFGNADPGWDRYTSLDSQ